ncbi:MAG: hypothetical protein CFK48_05515 [Armatimonadetes bacterium CP1_7O]|nr:MAG: hypothetical protein CFK48_05515 [Armatimonadetes bacterium CP1_7O]
MRVVDEFTTVFRAVDQFSGQVDRMTRSLQRFKGQYESLEAIAGAASAGAALSPSGVLAALASANPLVIALGAAIATLTAVLTGAIGIFAGSAGALYAIGRAAVPTAAELQQLEAVFVALTGSAAKAQERMQYLLRFAETSVFEFPDLVRVATQLEAFGLNIQRILPLITQMAAAFGANRETLEMLANAFGRMAAGQFGEAMEAFRRVGISAGDLMAEGIRISTSGEIQSSVREVFAAIERIAQARFGDVAAVMGATLAVQLSNLRDSFTRLLAEIGRAILPALAPIIERIQSVARFLETSGLARAFGERIAQILQNQQLLDTATRALFTAVAVMEMLPQIVQAGIQVIASFLQAIYKAFETIAGWLRRFGIDAQLGGFSLAPLMQVFEQIQRRADELMRQFQMAPGVAPQVPTPQGDYFTRQVNELQRISDNTRQIAEHTRQLVDLQRIALGGGELGQRGISLATRLRLTRYQPRPASQEAEQLISQLIGRLRGVRAV